MPAYLIVNFAIEDADLYKSYQKGAIPALGIGSTSKPLAVDRSSLALEGDAGDHTVVLEFESTEAAKAAYDSGDYQAVLPDRLNATSKHFCVIAAGL